MKRCVCIFIPLLIFISFSVTGAEPSPSPVMDATPTMQITTEATPSPSPNAGLISYNVSGERVVRVQLRLRELGFFNFKPTGLFQAMSVSAAKKFQQLQRDADGNPIIADGTVGEQSIAILFTTKAIRANIIAGIPIGKSLTGTPAVTGVLLDWSEVLPLFSEGQSYNVVDYNTGAEFSLTFVGGKNHAEMEATAANDTEALKTAFGNAFSFFKRPVVISVGEKKIAASLQGFPHGSDQVFANDMDGHVCLYFLGSLSHVGSLPDVEHLNQVYKAAGR